MLFACHYGETATNSVAWLSDVVRRQITVHNASFRVTFASVWSGDKLAFHRNQKSAEEAATTSVADGARNLCWPEEEERREGDTRAPARARPHTRQKTPKFIRQRARGVTPDDTRDTIQKRRKGSHCITKQQTNDDTTNARSGAEQTRYYVNTEKP